MFSCITGMIRLGNFLLLAIVVAGSSCQHHENHLFKKLSSSYSHIEFNNTIAENDSINPIDLDFLYNGGGVATGDFNNDSLPDLYFTASMVSNKLYLNKGKLVFDDVTTVAGVSGSGRWCNAASVVDINHDGWQDIYVCTTIKKDPEQRRNLLYVNQGLNKDGIPIFKEMAAEYGLADTSYSVHAAFFDYDNDGDLDMYLVTTQLAKRASASFSSNRMQGSNMDVDKLFCNDWNDSLGHPVFTNVSAKAGITENGFGLGIAIADINRDGWKDIYVSNDFYGSDLLYINNKDGTFSNKAKEYFKHTSQNAMGNDIADINNDGLADIITVDMNPEDNYRKKKNMNGNNYFIYQNMRYQDMVLQYVRNTLQLNCGPVTTPGDSIPHPVFSDISFYTNTAETDWSWSPLLADVNNDGNRDILITNGYPKDVTDHDFAAFRESAGNNISKQQLIEQIPAVKIPNYAFENRGNLQFINTGSLWGMDEPSFSNGAVCIDLDNDGDLDYVINNINDKAFVYENTIRDLSSTAAVADSAAYLSIQFEGTANNKSGIGAWAEIYYDHGKKQVYENSPYRGYLSTGDTKAFFGLDKTQLVDSIIIIWPDNKMQKLQQVKANQRITVSATNANETYHWNDPMELSKQALFSDVTHQVGVDYQHQEQDYIDFDKERLLPHKLSQYGPGLAAGDIDGNGLDDIVIGGTGDYLGKILMQQKNGEFITSQVPVITGKDTRRPENMGLLLFDADGDGDLDLYCASGSNEYPAGTKNYEDQFFINDGKGHFVGDTTGAIPINYTSKSCVKAADFDNDGDLDLFIGGRCLPGQYPLPVNSFIYRNDSHDGVVKFTDVTAAFAPGLQKLGMVCDALWTDFDGDGNTDLIIAGEWMPVSFFKNEHGKLVNITEQTGVGQQYGWWNSIAAGDFDNDGDIDYVVGNLGENSFFRASDQYPVKCYAKDFDGNGSTDAIVTTYLKDKAGVKKEYTAFNRDDITGQLPGLKKQFLTYKDFGNADFQQMFTEAQLKGAYTLHANNLKSVYLQNMGNGKFRMQALPTAAQLAPLYGIQVDDVDNDGNLDIVVTGNDFGNETGNGQYDAFNGLLLAGQGNGNFTAQPALSSGICIPGDGKALVELYSNDGHCLLAASQNKEPLKIFRNKAVSKKFIPFNSNDRYALLTLSNGATRKQEIYYGNSFLSQSPNRLTINDKIKKIIVVNSRGEKRVVSF